MYRMLMSKMLTGLVIVLTVLLPGGLAVAGSPPFLFDLRLTPATLTAGSGDQTVNVAVQVFDSDNDINSQKVKVIVTFEDETPKQKLVLTDEGAGRFTGTVILNVSTPQLVEFKIKAKDLERNKASSLKETVAISAPPVTARDFLFQQDIVMADTLFQTQLAVNSSDQEAHLFRAITRLLRIAEENRDGPDAAVFTDSLKELLDQFGFSPTERSIFDFSSDVPEDANGDVILPSSSPTGGQVQEFLRNVLLPELRSAIQDDLQAIDPAFSTRILSVEFATLDVGGDDAVEIDFGDVKLLEAALRGFEAALLITLAYDLNVDIDQIFNVGDTLMIQLEVIEANPPLFTLTPDGVSLLAQAKTATREAIDAYFVASAFIRSESDDQDDDFITIEAADLEDEENLREDLGEVQVALNGLGTIDDERVDLSRFFDTPFDVRDIVPPVTFDANEDPPNFVEPGTFPDPTLNGILPDMSQERLTDDVIPVPLP